MTITVAQSRCTFWSGRGHVLKNSDHAGSAYSSIYHRRAEDMSIEFNPVRNGQDPLDVNSTQFMGKPLGVWTMDD
eukprot:2163483-Amphidinium_carterae.1